MRIDSLFEMVHVAEYQKSVRKCTGQEGQTSCPVFAIAFQMVIPLYHPGHETAHSFRRLILHLASGVGIGAQGEACVIVAQHTGYRFDVHAVLQRHHRQPDARRHPPCAVLCHQQCGYEWNQCGHPGSAARAHMAGIAVDGDSRDQRGHRDLGRPADILSE